MSNPNSDPKFMERRELRERLNRGDELVLIDVRSTDEFATGHIDGAINIPASELSMRIGELPSNATIVMVCNFGGARSCGAAEQLQRLGYSSVCRFEVACAARRTIRAETWQSEAARWP